MPKYLCRIIDDADGPGPEREIEATGRWGAAELFVQDRNRRYAEYPDDGDVVRVEVRDEDVIQREWDSKPSIYRVRASHELNYYARAEEPNDSDT